MHGQSRAWSCHGLFSGVYHRLKRVPNLPVVEHYYSSLAVTPLLSIHGTWVDSYIEMLNSTGIRIFTGTLLPWYMKLVYGLSTTARHESPTVGRNHLQMVLNHTTYMPHLLDS